MKPAISVSVVTSCSAKGWEQYGRRCVETFDKFWPPDVNLYIVSEDALPVPPVGLRLAACLNLNSNPDAAAFLKRHAANLRANGLRKGNLATIRDKQHGYNFRMDAFKFSKKVFAIRMAADLVAAGRLIWLDADVVTTGFVPYDLLLTLPPAGSAIAYLDRKSYHSECGFVGYNLDHPMAHHFISEFARTYATDLVFKLKEWNDCFVFDHLRRAMCVPTYAIPHKSVSHPFVHSVLGDYMDHLKGNRKQRGASPDHPKRNAKA